MRQPVPSWEQCEKTVLVTARYWWAKFRRRSARTATPVLTLDDLIQEGWLVAHKVLKVYDPKRAALSTVLYVALHRHYARLLKESLSKTFQYSEEQRRHLYECRERFTPPDFESRKIRRVLALLETLPQEDQELVCDLIDRRSPREIAKRRQWSVPFTRVRIDQLRGVLKGAL